MGSETKVGLLVGMCFIVCFAIILAHRGAPEPQSETPPFEITTAQPTGRDQAPARVTQPVVEEPPPVQEATRTRSRGPRPTRRTDERSEPSTQLADRRSADRPAASDDVDRFTRRTSPIPAADSNDRLTDRRGQDEDQSLEELATGADAEAQRENEPSSVADDRSVATAAPADSGQALLNASKRATDALSGLGYQLASRTQHDQTRRQADVEIPRPLADGVTEIAAPFEAPAKPAPVEATPKLHKLYTVQQGDNLTRIARREYGDDGKAVIDAIYAANRDWMNSPDHLVVGKELRLPELASAPADNAGVRERILAPASGDLASANAHDAKTIEAMRYLQAELSRQKARDARTGSVDRTTQAASAGTRHLVQPGETLTRIVRRHYGADDAATLKRVFDANRNGMSDLNTLVVGTELMLPDGLGGPATGPALANAAGRADLQDPRTERSAAKEEAGRRAERWYVVKPGDVLSTVAQQELGSSRRWREIAALNKDIMPDPGRVRPGTRLRLPINGMQTVDAGTSRRARR
jgi:nucleoid-associated protein YgaU